MMKGMNQQKLIVESGMWPLYRYDPQPQGARARTPSSSTPRSPIVSKIEQFMYSEVRFKTLQASNPERAATLLAKEKELVERRWKEYKYIADRQF